MRYVTKLSTNTRHICKERHPFYTLCGKQYDDLSINRAVELGYTQPKELPEHLNIICKQCLKLYEKGSL